jgi:hypothetical protein
MQRKNTKLDFTGQEIYVGLDTHKKGWKISILTKELEHKTFSQPPRAEAWLATCVSIFLEHAICVSMKLDVSASGFMTHSDSKE